jgi:rRNA-processing protein FCF1
VGAANGEHFFVGTQDEKLRDKLRKARILAALLHVSLALR